MHSPREQGQGPPAAAGKGSVFRRALRGRRLPPRPRRIGVADGAAGRDPGALGSTGAAQAATAVLLEPVLDGLAAQAGAAKLRLAAERAW